MRPAHPIIVRSLVAALVLATSSCGGAGELRSAQRSIYDTDFAVVYGAALETATDLYPQLVEDPAKGKIATAWHEVSYQNTGAEDPKAMQNQAKTMGYDPTGTSSAQGAAGRLTAPQGQIFKRYFIRFDISVVGGRPWKVKVSGHASEWEPGNAVPSELRGPATPHWLPGRTEALVVAIHKRLKQYAIEVEENIPQPDAAEAVDLAAFGAIPEDAAKQVSEVRAAVAKRNYDELRARVASDVVWSLGGEPGVDGALAMWQADPAILEAMATAIDAGCRGDAKEVVCPPAATETPGYTGWRLALARRGDGWLVTSFVQGD
jgi:hypothetical protein